MRTILITGASSGIGEHALRTLHARPGWRAVAACRKPADVARLRAEGIACVTMDMADPASIESGWAEALDAAGGRVDAVFNNAGHGLPGAMEDVPPDALRAIFEVNVFGLHDLTRRAVAHMRTLGRGRIVQHSSGLGRNALRWRGAYNASKHAVEGLADTLRLELRGSGIHVATINTGPVTSRFRQNSVPHFERWIDWERSAIRATYEAELLPFLHEPGPPSIWQMEPEAVTRKLLHALEHPNPHPRYLVTRATHIAEGLRRFLPQRAVDALSARL